MNRNYLFLTIIFILVNLTYSQNYMFPESAVYDSILKRYFISNFGDGNIIQIDSLGNKSFFKTGLSKTLGMIIHNNILYVVQNPKSIKGFNLNDGSPAMDITINEALFLNDITIDSSDNMYVTDSNGDAIYKIELSSNNYSLFEKTLFLDPNGIIYDKFNNRLLICHFRENSTIDEINLTNSKSTVVVETGITNLDGIAIDDFGNIYVSSWDTGSFANGFSNKGTIYKYNNSFSGKPEIISTGHTGPADIYFNSVKNELVVPMFLTNEVIFIPIKRVIKTE